MIVQFVGLQWLISGIFLLVNIFVDKALWGWKLIAGILGILAGLSVFQHPLWSTVLLPTVLVIFLGITGLLIGFISLIAAFKGGGWAAGILGILSILFGLLLLGSPLIAAFTLPFLYGIIELVVGIGAIIASIRRKNENKGYPYDEK